MKKLVKRSDVMQETLESILQLQLQLLWNLLL